MTEATGDGSGVVKDAKMRPYLFSIVIIALLSISSAIFSKVRGNAGQPIWNLPPGSLNGASRTVVW